MTASPLFEPLTFARGPAMENRLMLAPMTSDQATPDGRVTPGMSPTVAFAKLGALAPERAAE